MATHTATEITTTALESYGQRLAMIGRQYQTWAAQLAENGVERVIAYEAAGLDKSVNMIESALQGAVRGWTHEKDSKLRESKESPTGYEWIDPKNELGDWEPFPPVEKADEIKAARIK